MSMALEESEFSYRTNIALMAFALSAANLALLPLWRVLILTSTAERYWMPLATPADQAAIIVTLVLLAIILFFLSRVFLALPVIPGQPLFILLLATCYVVPLQISSDTVGLLIPAIVATVLVTVAAVMLQADYRSFRQSRRFGFDRVITALIFPFYLVTPLAFMNAGESLYAAVTADVAGNKVVTPRLREKSKPAIERIVWIIFDELDQRILFDKRPTGYDYPAFDKFGTESIRLNQVVPPGGHTAKAMPTYFVGQKVEWAEPLDSNRLKIVVAGEERMLDKEAHIFKKARKLGATTAVAGFYHPYCRIFGEYLNQCHGYHYETARIRTSSGFFESLADSRFTFLLYWQKRYARIRLYRELLQSAVEISTNSTHQFILLHFGVPHEPTIYDAKTGNLVLWSQSSANIGYSDNLALADRTLAEIRSRMLAAELWNESVVVVTSDHGWKQLPGYETEAGSIPLMIKLKNQNHGTSISTQFDSVGMHDLLLALLAGNLATIDDVTSWIDQASSP